MDVHIVPYVSLRKTSAEGVVVFDNEGGGKSGKRGVDSEKGWVKVEYERDLVNCELRLTTRTWAEVPTKFGIQT